MSIKKLYAKIFFIIFFFLGISVVKDYGVSSDEYSSRIKGFVTLNYIGNIIAPNINEKIKGDKNIPELNEYEQKIYGVAFEAPASLLEILLKIDDKKNQFLLRHYLVFLIFFIGVIFFYKILYIRFNNSFLAILGSAILITSPRIFANSFYNNKDIVFLSLCIIALYFGIKYLINQNFKNSFLLALLSSISINVRILGILIPGVINFSILVKNLVQKNLKTKLKSIILNIFLTTILLYISWPYLWEAPINNFIFTFNEMSNFNLSTENLFFNKVLNSKELVWYYIPVWIIITTPILYILFFIIGLIIIIKKTILTKLKKENNNFYIDLSICLFFIIPLIYVIVFNSTLYNGWRQMYFIYPSIIYISMFFFNFVLEHKNSFFKKGVFFLTIIYIFNLIFWMYQNHPHQNVFFNSLVNKKELNSKFDLDYWGLSYKQNLEYIIDKNSKNKIKIYNSSENRIFYHLFALEKIKRERFIIVDNINEADFILTNFFNDKIYYTLSNNNKFSLYREIIVDDFPINRIYKKNN